ncbi:MAG TPA: hypothetical protein VFB16_10410 [Bauldia sp.]|nr:hypothetical protein [Bauldia sp.]
MTTKEGSRYRYVLAAALPLMAGLLLAGCNTSGSSGLFVAPADNRKVLTAADFATPYCPPVDIRGGTEALSVYDRAHQGEAGWVKYQASIGKTARECHPTSDTMNIKLGISGSVVGGPKGAPGNVTLPVRVAVVKQSNTAGKPLFSQLYKVPATLATSTVRGDFTFVQEISFKVAPADRDLIVYVGFDEGKKS